MTTIEQNGISYINITNPTEKKIEDISKLFNLHPLIKQSLLSPTFRPKVDSYDDLLYLVIHLPVYNEHTRISHPEEIDIIITQKTLVTVHYQHIPPLQAFIEELKNDEVMKKNIMRLNTARLTVELILRLFTFASRELAHIDEKISRIENDIFEDKQKEMVRLTSLVRSDIINFSRAMEPLAPVFEEFYTHASLFFGKQWNIYFANIKGEYRKMINMVKTQSQIIRSLQATNDSLSSFHANQFLKILAIINLLVMPIMIMEAIIGIRWYVQEIVGSFAVIEVLISLLAAALADFLLLWYFYYKKWL